MSLRTRACRLGLVLVASAGLLAGCSTPDPAPAPAESSAADTGSAAVSPTRTTPAVTFADTLGEPFETFLSRDPFRPVRPDALTAGDDGAPDPTLGVGVELVDIFTGEDGFPRAVMRFDGVLYTVASSTEADSEAGNFGPSAEYTVVAIDRGCAQVETNGGFFVVCEGAGPITAPVSLNDPDAPTSTDGCTAPSSTTTCDGLLVEVIAVTAADGQPRATIAVAGTTYEVGVGQVFATSFEVLAIDPPCATLLYGDDAVTLCQGDRVLK